MIARVLLTFILINMAFQLKLEAKIVTESANYKANSIELRGAIVYDNNKINKKETPAIVLFPDWYGFNRQFVEIAENYAKQGYIVLVADIYGKNVRLKSNDDKRAETESAKILTPDKVIFRNIAKAALESLKQNEYVNTKKISAVGYSLGGLMAIELARSGAKLKAVVNFHGNLSQSDSNELKGTKVRFLIHSGASDPFLPVSEIVTFSKELDAAKADYLFISYGNTGRAFTQKDAGNNVASGVFYSDKADLRSFKITLDFLEEANIN